MGLLLGEVNATLISLVPKIQNPDKVSDFRPIACCNVIYKCISKIITNRLKGVLGKLVHESQSALIDGRQTTDNILLAQELFKGYNKKQKIKKVAFKIDLQKAYDTINWNFVKVVLEQFGFPNKMVDWIIVCVSTTKFSININGEREGYFSGGRRLRQGDPMSLYLFTLVMEVFNIIMRKNIGETKDFKYHQGCKKLKITHLCFADDLLVFCHGDSKFMGVIKETLEEFSSYSGLKANMSKSTVFFGGLTNAEQSIILDIVPFVVGRLPVRYLGVPFITKKINATDWFMWCQSELTKRKAKISWDNVCKPKEQGGLGIPTGPLCDTVTTREIYEAGLSIYTTIAELVTSCEDNWHEGWINEYPILNQFGFPCIKDGVKLSTQDRIAVWKPNEVMQCVFCKQCLDSIEHLFFTCIYSKNVWKELRLLSVNMPFSRRNIMEELQRFPNNNNIWSIIRKLMFGAVAYYIWQERNNRVFRDEKIDEMTLVQIIKEIIQLRITGFAVKDSKAVKEVEAR
nr:RNA-directed DNA polymerase, eukaryota, reverse transcriptase zinc-binding domain protein [Tanacetum cinerariifolium]